MKKKVTNNHDHDKYITTQEFNKLIFDNFVARLAEARLASKSDVANFIKRQIFMINWKI